MNHKDKSPNPYLFAVFTAFLAAALAALGSYSVAKYQMKAELLQRERDVRKDVYLQFLAAVDRRVDPTINEFLNIGGLAETVASDSDIQALENRLHALTTKTDTHELFLRISGYLAPVRMVGSKKVNSFADDLLNTLLMLPDRVKIKEHSVATQEFYGKWAKIQTEGVAYGWDERVSPEHRLSLIVASRLFLDLIQEMGTEAKAAAN